MGFPFLSRKTSFIIKREEHSQAVEVPPPTSFLSCDTHAPVGTLSQARIALRLEILLKKKGESSLILSLIIYENKTLETDRYHHAEVFSEILQDGFPVFVYHF